MIDLLTQLSKGSFTLLPQPYPYQLTMNNSTFFSLMAEYGTGDIPLEHCCDKYFGMRLRKASSKARLQQLPVPVYRGGSQKSMWLISAVDLANHIDELKQKAKHDWERLK